MVSQGYRDWLQAGKPYTLILPAADLQRTLRGYGLTVYDYPDDAHLQANTPEDHTPFSVTGWPDKNARWKARALDIMPRKNVPDAQARGENAAIARQIIRDRDAGHPGVAWIKYLNWTDERGYCSQERWTTDGQPNRRTTRGSSDKGHVHISGRSDADTDTRARGYDPIARASGAAVGEGDEVPGWDETIGAGYSPDDAGYGIHKFRTAIGYIWAGVDKANAAAAADATRDASMQAAIETMGKALNAVLQGEAGGIEVGPIIAAVREEAEKSRTLVEQLHAELAAARAENGDLRERLATAFGPGSE